MRQPPKNAIAKDAIKVWRILGSLFTGFLLLVSMIIAAVSYFNNFTYWFTVIAIIITLLSALLFIVILPKLRWRRWRYEVFEQEIYIQYGILIVSRTLVPMIRVQHVDTKQGPILKQYSLATVTVSTAATTHEIPALLEEDASALRDRISALARVDEDDV